MALRPDDAGVGCAGSLATGATARAVSGPQANPFARGARQPHGRVRARGILRKRAAAGGPAAPSVLGCRSDGLSRAGSLADADARRLFERTRAKVAR